MLFVLRYYLSTKKTENAEKNRRSAFCGIPVFSFFGFSGFLVFGPFVCVFCFRVSFGLALFSAYPDFIDLSGVYVFRSKTFKKKNRRRCRADDTRRSAFSPGFQTRFQFPLSVSAFSLCNKYPLYTPCPCSPLFPRCICSLL